MNWLNYHHLYYFFIIAREGGIRRASRFLNVTQSALSNQLKTLEEITGQELFERVGRNLRLTPMGRKTYEYAEEIFKLGEELKDVLHSNKKKFPIHITMGTPNHVSKAKIGLFVTHLIKKYKAGVTVLEEPLENLLKHLGSYRIDCIISDVHPTVSPGFNLARKVIGNIELLPVAHPRYSSLRDDFPMSLHQTPLLLPLPATPSRLEIEAYLEKARCIHNILVEAADEELVRRLVKKGEGVGILSRSAVADDLAAGELIPLTNKPIISEQLWLLAAERRLQNRILDDLLENFDETLLK